ncbi:hypothetical protein QE358_002077 [Sphingomonas sp. SORGH_AS742]|nr:hypothetical protein [Sphingomonas sp. SORGH_AS_0742]
MAVVSSVNEKMKAMYIAATIAVTARKPSVPAVAQP